MRLRARSSSADQHSCHAETQVGPSSSGQSASDRSSESACSISRGGNAASRVEVHETVGRECTAAQGGIVDARGGADGQCSVFHPFLDPSREAHERGQAEVDGGLERSVGLGFRQGIAIERDGVLWACLDAGQMGHDRCALVAGRSSGYGLARGAPSLVRCSLRGSACPRPPGGAGARRPASAVGVSLRACSASSAAVAGAPRACVDRAASSRIEADLATRLCRREREVARALLGGRRRHRRAGREGPGGAPGVWRPTTADPSSG